MHEHNHAFQRALMLAVVTGLRAMTGPALVAAAQRRPERQGLAMAALGEMVLDKVPMMPSRSSLPLMIPRALAAAWVAKTVMEEEGVDDPWAMPMAAAVAAGVATFAPKVRALLHGVLGIPGPMLGLAEDYLALRLGTEAVGMSMGEVGQVANDSFGEVKERLMSAAGHPAG